MCILDSPRSLKQTGRCPLPDRRHSTAVILDHNVRNVHVPMFSVPARFLFTGRLLLLLLLFFGFFLKGYFKRSQLKQSECLDQNVSFMYCVFRKKQWIFDILKKMAFLK